MPSTPRPPIDSEMKREIRQRCKFGCVMCGSPVFDYEHMTGYTITGHVADDITLLCPMHHREKTAGRLPTAIVRRANDVPHNQDRKRGTKHPTYFDGEILNVELGNVWYSCAAPEGGTVAAVIIDGEPIVSVRREDDALLLSAVLRDENNRPMVAIKDGQLMHSLEHWDVEYVGQSLTVRRAQCDPSLRIRFDSDCFVIERASIWCRGVNLTIGTAAKLGGIRVENTGNEIADLTMQNARTGIRIGDGVSPNVLRDCVFAMEVDRRWHGGWTGNGDFYRATSRS